MELKEILNFQNFLLIGLAGVTWQMIKWKVNSMCKRLEKLESLILKHLIK